MGDKITITRRQQLELLRLLRNDQDESKGWPVSIRRMKWALGIALKRKLGGKTNLSQGQVDDLLENAEKHLKSDGYTRNDVLRCSSPLFNVLCAAGGYRWLTNLK